MMRSTILSAALAVTTLAATAATAAAQDNFLPPDAEHALERLNDSPRHGDWLTVRMPNGDSVRSWIVYPERSDPAPVVVVIHEIYGLTHWARAVADRLAAEGFIAVAPNLITGQDIPRTDDGDPERDAAIAAIRALDADVVHRQVRAVAEHVMAMPSARPVYGIVGYCWGGGVSFAHATRYADLGGAVVYYGSSPDEAALEAVRAPVLGLYGGDDARVNSTIPRAEAALPWLYRAEIFDGAGHGFLRALTGRDGANLAAAQKAWPMTIGFFHGALTP